MVDRVLILNEEETEVLLGYVTKLIRDSDWAVDEDDLPSLKSIRKSLKSDPLDGWEPGPWWQVIDADIEASETDPDMAWRKALWCETSDEAEARLHMENGQKKGKRMRLQHLWRRELHMMLTDEDNAVAMSHWRGR